MMKLGAKVLSAWDWLGRAHLFYTIGGLILAYVAGQGGISALLPNGPLLLATIAAWTLLVFGVGVQWRVYRKDHPKSASARKWWQRRAKDAQPSDDRLTKPEWNEKAKRMVASYKRYDPILRQLLELTTGRLDRIHDVALRNAVNEAANTFWSIGQESLAHFNKGTANLHHQMTSVEFAERVLPFYNLALQAIIGLNTLTYNIVVGVPVDIAGLQDYHKIGYDAFRQRVQELGEEIDVEFQVDAKRLVEEQ